MQKFIRNKRKRSSCQSCNKNVTFLVNCACLLKYKHTHSMLRYNILLHNTLKKKTKGLFDTGILLMRKSSDKKFRPSKQVRFLSRSVKNA